MPNCQGRNAGSGPDPGTCRRSGGEEFGPAAAGRKAYLSGGWVYTEESADRPEKLVWEAAAREQRPVLCFCPCVWILGCLMPPESEQTCFSPFSKTKLARGPSMARLASCAGVRAAHDRTRVPHRCPDLGFFQRGRSITVTFLTVFSRLKV